MSIRLFRASGIRRKRNRVLSPVIAVALIASAVSAVLFGTAQPASAAVEDYKPANWNMQGAQSTQDSKWQVGVRRLIRDGHDVIALQEVGQPPASAGHVDSTGRIVPGPAGRFTAWYANDYPTSGRPGGGWTIERYQWRPEGSTRGGTFNIYFMQTDFGGNRVNLAIVTSHLADRANVARPGFPTSLPATSRPSRPALGIRLGDTYFWSVHALANQGRDARELLGNIQRASGNYRWAAMGDFNREPQNLTVAPGMHIYRTGSPTHYGGGNNGNHELDYMVSNEVIPSFTPGSTDLTSDHRAVFYRPLVANADVHIRVAHDGDKAVSFAPDGPAEGGHYLANWTYKEEEKDFHWRLRDIAFFPGYYRIVNNENGDCMDDTHTELSATPCNGSSHQMFKISAWNDTGQTRIQPVGRSTCVGDGPEPGSGTPLLTTVSCKAGEARFDFKYDRDPGAAGAVIVGRGALQTSDTYTVAEDGSAQFTTVQGAIDAVPTDGQPHTIVISKGTYTGIITVPKSMVNLTIRGATGKASDVVIQYDRAHGYTKPDGTKYGTEGSAVASFKASDMRVENLTIQNTFDPKAHPEVDPYETQAVALAATGDRQVYSNVRLISTQDTVLTKSPVATDQHRMYFRNSYIAGSIDFLFGNATAVFDRSTLHVWPHIGGTIVAPNTDEAKKYGLLITNSKVVSSAAAGTFHLGRPWHNTTTARPQAVIRDTELPAGIKTSQPWTDMTPDYSWRNARFFEYHNYGAGAGVNANRPQMTDAQARDYTAQAYLAGTDGWNPIW